MFIGISGIIIFLENVCALHVTVQINLTNFLEDIEDVFCYYFVYSIDTKTN